MKLRGRPEEPDQTPRAHNVFRARGADTQTAHGPLQRLLEDASNEVIILPSARSGETKDLRLSSQLFMTFKMSLGRGL